MVRSDVRACERPPGEPRSALGCEGGVRPCLSVARSRLVLRGGGVSNKMHDDTPHIPTVVGGGGGGVGGVGGGGGWGVVGGGVGGVVGGVVSISSCSRY